MKTFQSCKILPEHAGLTVEQYLKQVLKISGRKLQQLTRQKGVLLNGRPVYLQRKLQPRDSLRVLAAGDSGYGAAPEPGPVEVLYEDDYLLVLNKPPRLLVHPAGRTGGGTLANYLANRLRERGIVSTVRPLHRLDRDTSGCVIFAGTARSQFMLEQQIKDRSLKRLYWALVNGVVAAPAGTVAAPIGADPGRPNRRTVTPAGEPAVTHYRVIRTFPDATLLELTLETGRTHQIRVHLSYLGHPVIGDAMYGTRSPFMPRQALHAAAVTFRHPENGRAITVHAPLPPDFALAIDRCAAAKQ